MRPSRDFIDAIEEFKNTFHTALADVQDFSRQRSQEMLHALDTLGFFERRYAELQKQWDDNMVLLEENQAELEKLHEQELTAHRSGQKQVEPLKSDSLSTQERRNRILQKQNKILQAQTEAMQIHVSVLADGNRQSGELSRAANGIARWANIWALAGVAIGVVSLLLHIRPAICP